MDADALDLPGCLADLQGVASRCIEGLSRRDDGGRSADLAVKMFGTMMAAYLSHLLADPDHPAFLPSVGYHQMYGSPSPDTVYRTAVIDGSGEYLITGHRGTTPNVTIMPFGAPTGNGLQTFPPFDLGDIELSDGDSFEVVLSERRPEGARNWWPLNPGTRTLMLRSVSDRWGEHMDPRVAIVRLDRDARRERLDTDLVRRRLHSYAAVVEAYMMSGINRVADLRAQEVVNRLVRIDYSANGGLDNQWYFEGCFSLGPDEVLLVETPLPSGCTRFSLSLTDPFFSTLDWTNAQSSLNHSQASVDADGILRVVVAGRDPMIANWLDSMAHESGVLQCRWIGGAEPPRPSVKVLNHSSLEGALSAVTALVTPEERIQAIRARQIGVQLRSLW